VREGGGLPLTVCTRALHYRIRAAPAGAPSAARRGRSGPADLGQPSSRFRPRSPMRVGGEGLLTPGVPVESGVPAPVPPRAGHAASG